MEFAVLECSYPRDIAERLVPAGVTIVDRAERGYQVEGETSVIPAAVVRLHTTLVKVGNHTYDRRCKLVAA